MQLNEPRAVCRVKTQSFPSALASWNVKAQCLLTHADGAACCEFLVLLIPVGITKKQLRREQRLMGLSGSFKQMEWDRFGFLAWVARHHKLVGHGVGHAKQKTRNRWRQQVESNSEFGIRHSALN